MNRNQAPTGHGAFHFGKSLLLGKSIQALMGLALLGLAFGGTPSLPAVAADEDNPVPEVAPPAEIKPNIPKKQNEVVELAKVEIDLLAFLTWDSVLSASDGIDPVWQLKATPGKTLLQIPLVIEPDKVRDIELGTTTFRVRNGQFVCYRLESAKAQSDEDPGLKRDQHKKVVAKRNDALPGDDLHPDAPSRLTRRLIITPDGEVQWKLDYNLDRRAELKASAGQYRLRIRPDELKAKAPAEPAKLVRNPNENFNDFARRKRQQDLEFLAKRKEFNVLLRQIMGLPTEFAEPVPLRIWAIFEIPTKTAPLTIDGPKPLPWDLDTELLNALRLCAKPIADTEWQKDAAGGFDKNVLPVQRAAAVEVFADALKREKHPYTLQSIANVMSLSRMVGFANVDDPLFKLIEDVINGGDGSATATVMKEIITTISKAAAVLGTRYAKRLTEGEKRELWEREFGNVDGNDPAAVAKFIRDVNDELAKPDGQPVARLIDSVLKVAAKYEKTVPQLVSAIPFHTLPPARRDQAIAAVLSQGTSDLLAAVWINDRLLAPNQPPQLVKRTLEILSTATIGGQAPPKDAGAAEAAEVPVVAEGDVPVVAAGDALNGGPAAPAAVDAQALAVMLPRRLLIHAPDHSILRLLAFSDDEIKALAWDALRYFDMSGGLDPAGVDNKDRFDVMVTAALAQRITPPQVVEFLSRQTNTEHRERVVEALVRLVQRADTAASVKAARALLGREGPIEQLLLEKMSPEVRMAFVRRLYSAQQVDVPLVVGLMKENRQANTLVVWFANEIIAGRLPDPSKWAEAYERDPARREEALLRLVAVFDQDLAKGAMSALVNAAGGDDVKAQEMFNEFGRLVDKGPDAAWAWWIPKRQEIFLGRLKSAQGPYRLKLRVPGVGDAPPKLDVVIAAVQLQVSDKTVSFGNAVALSIPFLKFAIRVDKPAQLKSFNNPEIANLPLDGVREIDLMPEGNGVWRALFSMPGHGDTELILEPAKDL